MNRTDGDWEPKEEDPADGESGAVAPLDRILESCLNRPAEEWEAAVKNAIRIHPEHSEALNRRFRSLVDSGLMDIPDAGLSTLFGDFELSRLLGAGGMGSVYLARQRSSGNWVALKLIRPEYVRSPISRKRFEREIALTSRMEHPGICPVFESGEIEGTPYVAMKYIEGPTLAQLIRSWESSEVFPQDGELRRVLAWFSSLAETIHVAHCSGLIHRDLKPENIIIEGMNTPVILDFGLARELETKGSLTAPGSLLGTPLYLPPEAIDGRAIPDPRHDIYALGVSLYQTLCLCPPFQGATREQLYKQILSGQYRPPSRRRLGLSSAIDAVVGTAMASDLSRRYATAREFGRDLKRLIERRKPRAKTPSLVYRSIKWFSRNRWAGAFFAALMVALLITAGFLRRMRTDLQQVRALNLAGQSAALTLSDPVAGLELALEAVETKRLPETWSQLYGALAQVRDGATLMGHGDRVWSGRFSHDSKRCLTTSPDGSARLWSRDGLQIGTFQHDSIPVTVAEFSPSGNRLATCDALGRVHTWTESVSGEWVKMPSEISTKGRVTAASWVDEETLILADPHAVYRADLREGTVEPFVEGRELLRMVCTVGGDLVMAFRDGHVVWLREKNRRDSLELRNGSAGDVVALDIVDSDPPYLLIAEKLDGNRERLRVGRLAGSDLGEPRIGFDELFSHSVKAGIEMAKLSRDCDYAVIARSSGDVEVFGEGGRLAILGGHGSLVHDITISHDGSLIATSAGDGVCRFFDKSGALIDSLLGHKGHVIHGEFSNDDRWFLSSSQDRTARTWSVTPSAVPKVLGTYVGFGDGGTVLIAGPEESAYRWNPENGSRDLLFKWEGSLKLGNWIDGDVFFAHFSDGQGQWLDIHGEVIMRLPVKAKTTFDAGRDDWLGIAEGDGVLFIQREGNRWKETPLEVPWAPVCATASKGGDVVLIGGVDGEVAWFEGLLGPPKIRKWHQNWVRAVSLSEDAQHGASGSRDNTAVFWSLSNPDDAVRVEGHSGTVTQAYFSNSLTRQPLVTMSADKSIRLWSSEGELSVVLRGHTGIVERGAFDKSGTFLLSVGFDCDVRLWCVDSEQVLLVARHYCAPRSRRGEVGPD